MRWAIGLVLSMAIGLGLSACGSSSHTSSHTSSTGLTISAYVVRGNEETGFHPAGRPQVAHTVTAGEAGNPNAAADEKRLTSEGFSQGVMVNTSGADGGAGGSSVTELRSAAMAAREQHASVQEAALEQGGPTVSHFAVARIPGSTGIVAAAPAGSQSTANLYFREGRCALWVGDETSKPDYRAAVTAAAVAIYASTNGRPGPCTG
ncbi:MAG: hypothetical protein WAK93_13700 [Solirubrobacteraceae bacterium]